MNIFSTNSRRSGLSGHPSHCGMLNSQIDHNITNRIHGHSNKNVGNVTNSYNNTTNTGRNEESLQIQAWLSPLESLRRHQDVRNRRLDGVGDWVPQRDEFKSWRESQDDSQNPTLRCYGGQGVGKTYISSLVIDTLHEQARGRNIAVLSLYCDYKARKDQSAVNMIGSLLRQITAGAMRVPDEIKNAFEESRKEGGRGLRLRDMIKLFVKTISSIERIYICVDAVDELLPQDRSELLRALRQIVQDAPNTRLFLTGRPYVSGELDRHLTKRAFIIRIIVNRGDIVRYLNQKMDDDDARDPELMTEELKNDIMRTILEKASEMFLLVTLNIDAILSESSLARRRKMLKQVATTGVNLDSVYAQTLQRIREQKGDRPRLGMEILMWLSHSERPMGIDELRHALAVEVGSTDIDPENIRSQDTVVGSCLGLVRVDKETSTVRLIHYTLQKYLSSPGILPDAHRTLAQSCLVYLNYEQVRGLPANNAANLRKMPFLKYSSYYWPSHAMVEPSNRVKSLALELLNQYDNHISATLLFQQIGSYMPPSISHHLFTGLHCASYFGMVEAVAALIEVKGCNINQSDCMGFTPFMRAAQQGNEGVARLLLTRDDINPDKPNNDGQTPLWCASFYGHEGMVKLLLTRDDINPDKPNNYGQTPLGCASSDGHEGVVKLLLARDDVNPDKPDNYGETPLWCASDNGHEGVVKLLLTQGDANPDKPNSYGKTPLWLASSNGHEGVVKLLLTTGDTNPDKLCNNGETPLWRASSNGHKGVVKLLLTRDDVNPNKPIYGETPLWCASLNGHEGVVKLLLTRADVDPEKPDNGGRTPLWCASSNGHEAVVRVLLTRSDVNADKPGKGGETPLWGASQNGYMAVVQLLLTREDVNPDRPDNYGKTPLWAASSRGCEEVVRLLLTRDDVDPDKPDNNGETPLQRASLGGHERVVRLLLTRNDVNLNRPDHHGQTPLSWASSEGCEGVVRLLLTRDDVDPDKPNNNGETPLWLASSNGHKKVVELLLSRVDVSPDSPDKFGETPLWRASLNGHVGVVRVLLARDDISPNKPDNRGRTLLWQASLNGCGAVVQLPLAWKDVDPSRPDDDSQTPLWCASKGGLEGVVSLLLPWEGIKPNEPRTLGQMPLWCASWNGCDLVLRLLLRMDGLDPDKLDNDGQVPLWRVLLNRRDRAVSLLHWDPDLFHADLEDIMISSVD